LIVFVVDTNILVYAADRSVPEHEVCYECLMEWRKQTNVWYLTWGIVYEFMRVTTHPRVFRRPLKWQDSWDFIQAIQASPGLNMLTETERHSLVISEVLETIPLASGNFMFDVHTAILMKEHGVRTIYTRDTDFHRFPFLETIDPLQK